MYAVIRTGGKQYRVTAGDILEVEKLDGSVGETVTLEDVLMVSTDEDVTVGQPLVDGASVTAKITGQYRGKKIMVFRYRPKKRIRVRKGHRQYLTRLEIESISANGETFTYVAPQPEAAPLEEPVEETPAEETVVAADAVVDEPIAEESAAEIEVEDTSAAAQDETETATESEDAPESESTDSDVTDSEATDSEAADKE